MEKYLISHIGRKMDHLKHMSRVVRKPAFCICENKDADQLPGNREADQRLCFRYTDSTIYHLPKYEISSFQPSSLAVQPGLCGTWSETPKTGFLRTRLILGFIPWYWPAQILVKIAPLWAASWQNLSAEISTLSYTRWGGGGAVQTQRIVLCLKFWI